MQINGKDITVLWETYRFGQQHRGSVVTDISGELVVHSGPEPQLWSGVFDVYREPPSGYITLAEVQSLYNLPKVVFTDHEGTDHDVVWVSQPTIVWDDKGTNLGHVQFAFEELL